MQVKNALVPELDGLRGTVWPEDLLVSLFSQAQREYDAPNLRLVNKEWRRIFDYSLHSVRIDHASSECAHFLAKLHGLTELNLSTTMAPGLGGDDIPETLLAVASNLPRLRSLVLGLQFLLRAKENVVPVVTTATASTSSVEAAEVKADALRHVRVSGIPSTTAVVKGPCSRYTILPATAVGALTGLRRLSIGGSGSLGPCLGNPPMELPYGSLTLELPQELLGLRCLEHLELYGIPLVPPRGCSAHLSRLSLLSSLHLAGSASSLARSATHLTDLIALRRLVLHCTAPLGISEHGDLGLLERMVELELADEAGAVKAAAMRRQPPHALSHGPTGGSTMAGRNIVAMLSTNSLLFMGLQRLAVAGVTLTELSYRGFFLTLPPPYLRQWSSLESLDLSHNTIMLERGILETQVACLTHLAHLDLSNNRLDELPSKLCSALLGLSSLNVSRNPISRLPAALSYLSTLTCLMAAGSCLVGLPPEVTVLTRLRHLDVSGNRLESLPEGLIRLSRLEKLQVSCNRLRSIPGLTQSWYSQVQSSASSPAWSSSPTAAADTSPRSAPTCSPTTSTAPAITASTTSHVAAASISIPSTVRGAELRSRDVDVDVEGMQGPDEEGNMACSCPWAPAVSLATSATAAVANSTDAASSATAASASTATSSTTANAPLPFPALNHLDLSSNSLGVPPLAVICRMSRLTTLAFGRNYSQSCLPDPTVTTTTTTTTTRTTSTPRLLDVAVATALLQPMPAPSRWDLPSRLVDLDIRMTAGFMHRAELFWLNVGQLTALTRLNAQSNALQALPPSWTSLTRLLHLDLSLNVLTHLPPGLSALHHLRHLSVSSNHMTGFPAAAAAALSALTFLDMSVNLLEDLPEELGEGMTRLRVLDLHYNSLCLLPPSITRLVQLQKLDVSRNYGLKELPYGIAELPGLTCVLLSKTLVDRTRAAVGSGAGTAVGPSSSSSSSSDSSNSDGSSRGSSQVDLLAARGVRVQVEA
ncbi:hypothetical protein VaNZ11_005226 [Volvox africanus]|uniref:Uncharacterized protein n=1 Tax=Volvox africanus TaxID=51714 RepID=A0ABQ5RZ79_9CHLO|nr:hypothetical protein VaNZ11_005226 [Volvox africanus]